MSFQTAARAAGVGQTCLRRILVAVVVVLAGLSLSCGNSSPSTRTGPNHNAYVTLPADGSVLLLHIDGSTGAISVGAQTPPLENTTPTGLALLSSKSKKFLYVANSRNDTISIFNVASDGTLTLSGTPTPAGSGPWAAVIDPSGKYLLVTNNYHSTNVSVFSIDPGSGALSEVAGSPFFANDNPTEILITPSGKFVYVTNPSIGMVTAFTFSSSNGALSQVTGSPFFSGAGAFGVAVDGSERYLYVANPAASNLPSQSNIGNISGFNIEPDGPNAGALTPIPGSPFNATVGNGPTALTVDPKGEFVYAVTPGSSFSIWCFTIASANGRLVPVSGSPFSLTAGELFALIDPSGNFFYIGSSAGTGIEGYTYNSFTGAPVIITGSPFLTGTPPTPPGKMVLSE
jgi:6-phosphogluconolactonase